MDELPPEAVDHLIKAFAHRAGLGVHPGKYQGPEVKDPFSIKRTIQAPGKPGVFRGVLPGLPAKKED